MSPASKRTLPAVVALSLLILATAVSGQLAGPGTFDLSWNTIDGGGGTSTGGGPGGFSLSGTIGQPDAGGPLTGGTFSLTGGFWPGADVPIDLCPVDITNDGNVNINDLLAVIINWGSCPMGCPTTPCPADVAPLGPPQGNCMININDLLAVIIAWGPCPTS